MLQGSVVSPSRGLVAESRWFDLQSNFIHSWYAVDRGEDGRNTLSGSSSKGGAPAMRLPVTMQLRTLIDAAALTESMAPPAIGSVLSVENRDVFRLLGQETIIGDVVHQSFCPDPR